MKQRQKPIIKKLKKQASILKRKDSLEPLEVNQYVQTSERLTTNETLEAVKSKETMIELVLNAGQFLSGLLTLGGQDFACKAGCHWCCYTTVGCTPPEVFTIAEYLRESLAQEELEQLKARVAEAAKQVKGLNGEERLLARALCPLLVNNLCSIYAYRPLSCKGWHSKSEQACKDSLDDPHHTTVEVDTFTSMLADSVHQGLLTGLQDQKLDHRELELITALDQALNDPEATTKWLAGETAQKSNNRGNSRGLK